MSCPTPVIALPTSSTMAGRQVVAHQPAAAPGQTGGGFVKHARYYCLLLAEGHPGCRIPGMIESLSEFVVQSAEALNAADSQRPTAVNHRSRRVYQPGIGPHPEDRAVDLIVAELKFLRPGSCPAPVLSRLKADLRPPLGRSARMGHRNQDVSPEWRQREAG